MKIKILKRFKRRYERNAVNVRPLSNHHVIKMRKMYRAGATFAELAGHFNVSDVTARNVCLRLSYKDVI